MYYAKNVNGGVTQITVNFGPPSDSDGGDTNVGIYELTGLSAISPLDDSAVNSLSNSKGSSLSVRLLNTNQNNDVCFAVEVGSGPQDNNSSADTTVTPGSGYSFPYNSNGQSDGQFDATNGERYYTEYAIVAAGGCKPNLSIAYPAYWAIVGAAFKP